MNADDLKNRFADAIIATELQDRVLRLQVTPRGLLEVCEFLRNDPHYAFDYPGDLTARDTGEDIVAWYRLHSLAKGSTALISITLNRDALSLPSVTHIWPGMNWHEREVFDMFGVEFAGHPDSESSLTMRLLLPEDWIGHPFRKDYEPVFSGNPLHGPQETN